MESPRCSRFVVQAKQPPRTERKKAPARGRFVQFLHSVKLHSLDVSASGSFNVSRLEAGWYEYREHSY